MENTEETTRSETKNITLGGVVSWIAGALFLLAGIGFMTNSVAAGSLLILGAAVLLPPVHGLIREKLNFNLSGGLRVVLAIILLAIGATMATGDTAEKEFVGTVMEDDSSTPAETEQVEPAQQEWVKVTEITASANKQSSTFTLEGGQQRVAYSVTGGDFGICTVYVLKEGSSLDRDGGFPEVMVDGGQTDETMMRKSGGDYYLDLKVANGNCTVELYELR